MTLRNQTFLLGNTIVVLAASFVLKSDSYANTAMLGASKDNTLINNSVGGVSNGAGVLIAGRTGGPGPGGLRALIAFDIASGIPAGAIITDVQLTLNVLQAGRNSDIDSYTLHHVEQDWGEGSSFAINGQGAASTTGDATWIHTFFDSSTWTNPGGDFRAAPSATQAVGDSGPFSWGSTSELVADVQGWLDDPSTNYGWILIGAENIFGTARQFASRESTSDAPKLTVLFTVVPEPNSLALASVASACCIFVRRRRNS